MWTIILRYLNGEARHIDAKFNPYWAQQMRSKMSQYFGKDAFSKGYIELYDHEKKETHYIKTKEELRHW